MNKTWFDRPVVRRALSLLAALVLIAGIWPVSAVQAETQYGYVNYDEVRFRRRAESTVVWTLLDTGWVVEIRSEKRSGGEDYYYVVTNIPKHLDRNYYGYINQDFITLMTADEVAQWQAAGGNGGEYTVPETPETSAPETTPPSVMTNYARPNNASTNYYSFDGNALTSLGLLSMSEAYYVNGSATISDEAYYIITVNGVNCYARANSMTMITTGDSTTPDDDDSTDDDTPSVPGTIPAGSIGTLRIIPEGNTNLRSSAAMLSNNVLAKIPQGSELPFYKTVPNGSKVWYYCYSVSDNEYGYILGTCAEVISVTTPETQAPTSKPTATPKPDSNGTAIGTLVIRPEGKTNIRKKPQVNSNNVVAQANQGEKLPYYAVSVNNGNRWYYVYYASKDVFGYVLGTCITLSSDVTDAPTLKPSVTPTSVPTVLPPSSGGETSYSGYVVLTAGGVNLRKDASTSSPMLGRYDKGDVFPCYATKQVGEVTWYKVITEDGTGYFHGSFCKPSDYTGEPTTPETPETETGYVLTIVDKLYLRKKASTTAGTYGQIPNKGTLLPIVGNSVKVNGAVRWYMVEYNGNQGYVRNDCVTYLTEEEAEDYKNTGTLPTPTPSPTPVPKPTEYIITTVDDVWIRKSPSTSAGTAGQVKKGTVLQFNGTKTVSGAKWYEITFDGATRYIKGSCVKVMTDVEYNEYLAALPTPTPTPTPTPKPDLSQMSSIALTVKEKVIVRANGNPSAKQLALVYKEGTECTLLGDTSDYGADTWYYLKVNGTTGWIRGDLIRVLTKTEAEMYEKHGDPDAKPEASYTTLQIGSTGAAVTKLQTRLAELGYLTSGQITGVYDTATQKAVSSYQKAAELTVDGIAGSLTQHALFGTVETGYYDQNPDSSTTVKLYKPELIDWYTGGIQSIFYKGAVATVTDVRTGISFKVKRWSGGHHADVEPLTAADTAAMCRIYKVNNAQEISDKNYYQRRPLLVTIGGHSYCASMFGMPHNYPKGDTISGNDFYGQFCIHFTNSQLHDGKGVDKPSAKNGYFSHTMAIKEAYDTAVKKLNIKVD